MAISLSGAYCLYTRSLKIRLRLLHFNLGRFISIALGKMNSAWRNILKRLENDRTLSVEPQQIRALLDRYFPQQQAQIDWQK